MVGSLISPETAYTGIGDDSHYLLRGLFDFDVPARQEYKCGINPAGLSGNVCNLLYIDVNLFYNKGITHNFIV